MGAALMADRYLPTGYDDRTTAAVRSVLVEIGQILGSYRGKVAVIGGAVPWLLLRDAPEPHVGTVDIDLGLDAESLGDGEYAGLVEALMRHDYEQRPELRRFQLVRRLSPDDGAPIDIIVDFLMPRDAAITRNRPPLLDDFAVQRADGADLAIDFFEFVRIEGSMPQGGRNAVEIAVCSIPALIAMKGHALDGRHKPKDAYDIHYCIRHYPGGIAELATACRPVLASPSGCRGFEHIAAKFDSVDGYGPTSVRHFAEESGLTGERNPDQWQRDAFGQVDALLRAVGLRQ